MCKQSPDTQHAAESSAQPSPFLPLPPPSVKLKAKWLRCRIQVTVLLWFYGPDSPSTPSISEVPPCPPSWGSGVVQCQVSGQTKTSIQQQFGPVGGGGRGGSVGVCGEGYFLKGSC